MSETAFLVEDFQELLSAARFSANLKLGWPDVCDAVDRGPCRARKKM